MARRDESLKPVPVAEYMKLRNYVVSLAERAGSEPAMIPSMNELGREFGVARMTVHKALKDLIRDKYLVVRKGIGTFTNPSPSAELGYSHAFNIGIVVDDGKHCFYDSYYWAEISAAGRAIAGRGHRVRLLNFSSTTSGKMAAEARGSWVDALIWLDFSKTAAKAMTELHESGFPVVAMQRPVEGVNCVMMDFERHGYEAGKMFLKEGRRNVAFAVLRDVPALHLQLAGIRRAFQEAGVKFDERLVLKNVARVEEDLEAILELGVEIQAVFIDGPHLGKALSALRRRKVDIKRSCRIMTGAFGLEEGEGFQGLVREYLFDEEAGLAVGMLERMLKEKDFSVERRLVEFPVRRVGGRRDSRPR